MLPASQSNMLPTCLDKEKSGQVSDNAIECHDLGIQLFISSADKVELAVPATKRNLPRLEHL